MKRILGFLMALMICLGVFTLVGGVNTVYAADIASGTYDGVSWKITEDGELILGDGTEQTFENRETRWCDQYPWYNKSSQITSIRFDGIVHGSSNMASLFQNQRNAITIDLTGFDTSNVSNFGRMFCGCANLLSIDVSGFDTSNATRMYSMFATCNSLKSLDLSNFDTSNVTDMSTMFYSLRGTNLEYLDISSFDTSKVTSFYGVGDPYTSSGNGSIFTGCNKLKTIVLGDKFSFKGNGVSTNSRDYALLPSPNSGRSWVRNDFQYGPYSATAVRDNYTSDMAGTWIWEPYSYAVLDESDGTFYFVRSDEYFTNNMTGTVHSVSGGEYTGKIFQVQTGNYGRTWSSIASQVKKVKFVDKIRPYRTSEWFRGFVNCTEMDLAKLDTSNVTDMNLMFYDCHSLTSLDVSTFDTSNVVNLSQVFQLCSGLQSLDVSSFNTSKATDTGYLFYGCSGLTSLDVSNFDTSNVTSMRSMFGGCENLTSLDLSNFDTSKCISFSQTFVSCKKLEYLDISSWNTSNVGTMSTMFMNCPSLKKVKLGEEFSFLGNNISYSSSKGYLPQPSTVSPYTGKWIRDDGAEGPYTYAELTENYVGSMAGTWVWEERDPNGYIIFDGNGGVISGNTKITFTESEGVHPFNTLDEDVCQHGTKFLMGWSEDKNATEPTYQPGEEINIGELETTKTLYAVWTADGVTRYHVKHYQQAYDLSGYTLTETERLYGQAGAEVTPDVKTYEGFAQPSTKTVTLAADGSTEVEYKYDRLQYRIHFDGNTATAGSMSDMRMLMGVGGQLRSNAFRKTGAIFTGWNTAADGSGTTYTDKANVVDLTNEHGSTVTLYAQWLENTNPAVTPTNGAVRVTLKQGQTVVIPDLPAGTSYTIREVSNPAGWEWKSTDGETGTITANQTNDATVHNVYHAVGSIPFEIYKVLEDGLSGENKPIEAGKFTFALVDASNISIMVASNEATDTDEKIYDADGNEVDNPNYGKALVSFDTIEYDESDIGKTYTYYISEINTPEGYEASEPVKVTVSIADAGKGQLDITASYDHNQEIKNTDKTGGFLEIKKLVSGSAPEGAEFTFKVDLSDADGRTYAESVSGVKSDESTLNITSGESITLKADESATFRLPAGVTYKVSEETADGWTLVQSSGESGEIVSGETAHAVFTNAYDVDGIVSIPATKNLVGKELTANEFEFVLEDADGNIVSQATNDAEGNITFNIPYTTEDVGKSYTYTAHEVIPDETFGITYDKTVFTVSVDVSAENGKLTGSVNIADHDSMVFNNTYAASTDITVSGKKVLTGRDFRDTDKWTFTLDGEGPKPAETSVEIYPAQGDEFSFTIPFNVSDMDGQRTKDFEYTVTESGFVPLVANDTSVKSFTVRVTDEGTGVMKAEIVDADNLDLTFTNRALVTLPMTGSMTSIWIMLAGLLVIAAGYAYSRKRKGSLSE